MEQTTEDNMPQFERSEYEQSWHDEADEDKYERCEYRGVTIFEYDGGWTFWYGPEDSDYVSSMSSKEAAQAWIDRDIERSQ